MNKETEGRFMEGNITNKQTCLETIQQTMEEKDILTRAKYLGVDQHQWKRNQSHTINLSS